MSNGDPVLNVLSIQMRRISIYCFCVVDVFVVLWAWVMFRWFGWEGTPKKLWEITSSAALMHGDTVLWSSLALLFRFCIAIAVLSVTVLYLVIAVWWKRRGLIHHRGVRVIDRREV